MLRHYKNKLRDAFDRLRVARNNRVIYSQQGQMDALMSDNIVLESQISKAKLKIKEKDQSTKSSSSKHLRKLCLQAFNKNI